MFEALLSAGTKLLGGLLGKSSQDEANRIAEANAANNIALQREWAQNAIQWKVADAQKAGIHPLYALGASTTSFSPVSVGVSGANPLASALGDMGQDVSRAASALRGPADRAAGVGAVAAAQEVTANKLRLENMDLQNQILRSKLATMNQPGTPPGVDFPVPENNKVEQRPPLMVFGKRWDTNPNTSPMKAWEDQYGDEGPIAWGMPLVIGANDAVYNAVNRLKNTAASRWWFELQRRVQEAYPYGRR